MALDPASGLQASVRAVLAGLLEVGQTRLQLASTELEEEGLRLAELLLWAAVGLFFLGIGVIFAGLLVVVLFWDGPREWALAGVTAVFVGAGLWAVATLRNKARNKPPFLAATLGELRRDRSALGGPAP